MKSFEDGHGSEWVVFEVKRDYGRASVLPTGYGNGWLCFESRGGKRRLMKYPENWRELPNVDLADLLQRAAPAPTGSVPARELTRDDRPDAE
ncbi:MAG: hypothetical protein JWO05_1487 [Gemmatimonadetes bacterium]|nr:hypothetical protein [Gemmatimonadota bacterium]